VCPLPSWPPLQALGVQMDLGPEGVAACIDQAGLGFMYAPRYHPAMGKLRPVRTALKVVGWGGGGGGGGS